MGLRPYYPLKRMNIQRSGMTLRDGLGGWFLLGMLLTLMSPGITRATDPLFDNETYLSKTIPGDSFSVDATNFLNGNTIVLNYASLSQNAQLFETMNTQNYTNNGLMVANAPFGVNGFFLGLAPGCGFQFDYQTTNVIPRKMATSFNNAGTIRANSFLDNGLNFLFFSTIGKVIVNATNIVNSGTIELGKNSLLQLTGKNVDLTRAVLLEEGANSGNTTDIGLGSAVDYGVGGNTNLWDPSTSFTATSASSSLFQTVNIPFNQVLFLSNSTAYIEVTPGVSNNVIRGIFIQNQLTNNVSYNVYWSGSPFGGGRFNIEWIGTFFDPFVGGPVTKYLYLNNNDALGSSLAPGSFPINFTFVTTNQAQFFIAPAPATNNVSVFVAGLVTNSYAYINQQYIATTIQTNNPSPANVTNYLKQATAGRIEITADNVLDLSLARISGQNYMSIQAPVQFNGTLGAQIFSPFADINIGVTNGFMVVSNLLEPSQPTWTGGVQAWSARWITVDANGFTNDYRIMVVNSALSPTAPAQVQDLNFHATNSLTVSDTFNVIRSFKSDAKNLTLTANGPSSASPYGELNMQMVPITGVNTFTWQTSFPNLQAITNYGAIRVPNINLATIGSAASPYNAFINRGIFTGFGVKLYVNNFESAGVFSNAALGSFILQAQTVTMTNNVLWAGGDISIGANTMIARNVFLQASRSLTLMVTNLLTDTGITNGSAWVVGTNSIGTGIYMPFKPAAGDLLGTSITNYAPVNRNVIYTWAGNDFNVSSTWDPDNFGASTAGYSDNVAVGRLILDALGPTPNTKFTFNGAGVNNAMYVDYLEFRDSATNRDSNGNVLSLNINSNNMAIYYARAVISGVDVSEKLNGKNNGRLRWVPSYAGFFSSTNIVSGGVLFKVNIGLAQSKHIDSDGDGTFNADDSEPFITVPHLTVYATNHPPSTVVINWDTSPSKTNTLYYSTNLATWQFLTNFVSPTNKVRVLDPMVSPGRYYKVLVHP